MSGQLARIIADAEILILDEPTQALDLKNQIVILDWIVGLSQEGGLKVVMTTNHPRMAAVAVQTLVPVILASRVQICTAK